MMQEYSLRANAFTKIGLFALSVFSLNPSVAADRPNVLFILADDIGYGDIGTYHRMTAGTDPSVPTPHIDRLAQEGMRFTDAHAPAALCAPTRYSVASGNNPYRGRQQYGVWRFNSKSNFLPGQLTVGEIAQAAGYHTAFIGKRNWGADWYDKNGALYRDKDFSQIDFSRAEEQGTSDRGFDYSFVLPAGISAPGPYAYFENGYYRRLDGTQSTEMFFFGTGKYGESRIIAESWGDPDYDSSKAGLVLSQQAVDFIDRHHSQNLADGLGTPFLMMYQSQAIHIPHTPPSEFEPGLPVAGVTGLGDQADMIVELDLQVGRIIKALEDRGILEDTLVIFTSDNGGLSPSDGAEMSDHDSTGGLRGLKAQLWEGGHRVPFIARWGDGSPEGSMIPPNSVSDQAIAVQDWVATFYAVSGQPMSAEQALDSADLTTVFSGTRDPNLPIHEFLLLQSSPEDHRANEENLCSGVRAGNHMLLMECGTEAPRELYDLQSDLFQNDNLIDEAGEAARVSQMVALHRRFGSSTSPGTTPALGSEQEVPTDVSGDQYEHDLLVRIIGERNTNLDVDLPVDAVGVAGMSFGPNAVGGREVLPAGTPVSSYLLHFDPSGEEPGMAAFSLTFDRPILGLIWEADKLDDSDDVLGLENVVYPSDTEAVATASRGAIGEGLDKARIRNDGRTVDLTLSVEAAAEVDQLRVLLAGRSEDLVICGAPEPAIHSGKEAALFLWEKDCGVDDGTRTYEVQVTAGAESARLRYQGSVTASGGPFAGEPTPILLEGTDAVELASDATEILFALTVRSPGKDGFEFTVPNNVSLCFSSNLPAGEAVLLGPNRMPAMTPFNPVDSGSCRSRPAPDL